MKKIKPQEWNRMQKRYDKPPSTRRLPFLRTTVQVHRAVYAPLVLALILMFVFREPYIATSLAGLVIFVWVPFLGWYSRPFYNKEKNRE